MKEKFNSLITATLILATVSVPSTMFLLNNFSTAHSANITDISTIDVVNTPKNIKNASDNDFVEVINTESEGKKENVESGLLRSNQNCSKLKLHDNDLWVCSIDESYEMIKNGQMEYYKNGGSPIINNELYSNKITANIYNKTNSLERKSYIYHMMLNSVDYFNTAKGSIEYSFSGSEPTTAEFTTNIEERYSHEKEYLPDNSIYEHYVYDGKAYYINETLGVYDLGFVGEPIEFVIDDSKRVVMLNDGELLKINRNDITNLGVSGNSCLFPQTFAMSKMYDFDNWDISGYEKLIDRECVVIEGAQDDKTFKMFVDVNYGFLIKYEEFSSNGDIISYVNTLDLENDIEVEKEVVEKDLINTKFSDSFN